MATWQIAEHKLTLFERVDKESQEEVYRAELNTPDGIKVVAAEKIPLSDGHTSSLNEKLLTLQQINSPYLTKFIGGVITEDEHLILVSEWAEKGYLDKYLSERLQREQAESANVTLPDYLMTQLEHLPDRLFCKWALQASLAVKYISQRDIGNGNIIKSHNFLITGNDNVKLSIFAIAKTILSGNTTKSPEETLQWIAPENLMVDASHVTPESNIFYLGLVIWELITGRQLLVGADDATIRRLVGIQNVRPEIPESVSPRNKNLLLRCWDADPKMRPEIQEIIDVIQDEWLRNAGKFWANYRKNIRYL